MLFGSLAWVKRKICKSSSSLEIEPVKSSRVLIDESSNIADASNVEMISEKGEEAEEEQNVKASVKLNAAGSKTSEELSNIQTMVLEGKSLNLFESSNPLRSRLFNLVTENRVFSWLIMGTILASAV